MKNRKYFIVIIGTAFLIKIFLFFFACIHAPQSKFKVDSDAYLRSGEVLVTQGAFALRDADGKLKYELRRTPGYPLFLGVLNGSMKIPLNGVILIQVLLTIAAAFFTYKTAVEVDPRLGFLSAALILYSPAITIYSLMILSESLFLFLMTLFMFYFVQYLKRRSIGPMVVFSLMLVLATYVRPGAYYLGLVMAFFLIAINATKDMKKTLCHVLILLVVVYGLLGLWQARNFMVCGHATFSSLLHDDPYYQGLYKSYSRNTDVVTKAMAPLPYYINVTARSFISIMTSPGSFKYFQCNPLTVFGKIFGYAWVILCMTGFVFGITKMGRNIYYQFLLLISMYFIGGGILAEILLVSDRFRVPAEPFMAIIAGYGWLKLMELLSNKCCLSK